MTSTMSMRSLRFGRYSIFQCATRSLCRSTSWRISVRGRKLLARADKACLDEGHAHKEGRLRPKDRSRSAHRRLSNQRKVRPEDETRDPRRQVEDEELWRPHHLFDECRTRALREHVEQEVDDTGVEKDRDKEAEGLVRAARAVRLAVEPAESAHVRHRTCLRRGHRRQVRTSFSYMPSRRKTRDIHVVSEVETVSELVAFGQVQAMLVT